MNKLKLKNNKEENGNEEKKRSANSCVLSGYKETGRVFCFAFLFVSEEG